MVPWKIGHQFETFWRRPQPSFQEFSGVPSSRVLVGMFGLFEESWPLEVWDSYGFILQVLSWNPSLSAAGPTLHHTRRPDCRSHGQPLSTSNPCEAAPSLPRVSLRVTRDGAIESDGSVPDPVHSEVIEFRKTSRTSLVHQGDSSFKEIEFLV